MSKKISKDKAMVRGFFRVQLTEDGKGVVGDSGWVENQVTNVGIQKYLIHPLMGDSGSALSVSHAALGTGGVPASDATTLAGEVEVRATVATSDVASRTAQFTAAFLSSASFVTTTMNISNIGLFNSVSTGTLFAGNTFASSSCATNQNVMLESIGVLA